MQNARPRLDSLKLPTFINTKNKSLEELQTKQNKNQVGGDDTAGRE